MPTPTSLPRTLLLAAVLAAATVPGLAAEAAPRARVGELVRDTLSTEHPYRAGSVREWEIHEPGATYIKVHFSKFDLAPGDRLEVATPDGSERYFFTGRGYKNKGEDFWGNSVLGDRAILRLRSVSGGGYGFDVDAWAVGTVPLFPDTPVHPESVCGTNDWQDVACYETSYPTEYQRAKSAVVVLYNGVENCTGVKVGCPNQILTNEHCVSSQTDVDVTEVRFEYQRSDCGGGTTSFSASYLGDQFIADNYTLDFCLLTVEGASDDYEAAEIDGRLPPVGERIYITGHPAGSPKQLSLEDSSSPTGLCQADISPIDGRGTDTDVGYYCDTTGGSSGSPVWSGETHKLIALHHFGGCPNSGVRMDLILPEIEDLLASCCDLPPNVPAVAATVPGDNRVDLTWDDSDLATVVEYRVLRSRLPGGPYEQIAAVADSSPAQANGPGYLYSDTDVSGGLTYYYVVRSSDGSTCTSDPSAEVSAVATGACTLDPVFSGAASIAAPLLETCTLELSWNAAAPECGDSVTYNVYRSTVPGFEPDGANLLASGVPTTAYTDFDQLVDGTTYHYVVRAVDELNGSEDDNLVEVSAAPAGQPVTSLWSDDAGDNGGAALTTGAGWTLDGTEGHLGPGVYKTGTYAADSCAALTTPTLRLGPGSELTFWSRYDIEAGADKGEVQISTDGGTTWERVAVDYPASASGTGDGCGLPAGTYFTGTGAAWAIHGADLWAWADQDARIRWVLSSDGATSGAGWWIDDVTVTGVVSGSSCSTGSACADNPFVNVTPEGPLTVCQGDGPTLSAGLTGGSGPFEYQWLMDGEPVPGATGQTMRPDDLGVHRYNVRVKAAGCPDDVFDGLDTQLYRVNRPFFGGIAAAVNPQSETCTVNLSWAPATTVCDGPVRYNVYRDKASPVEITPANLLAAGLTDTSYVDTFGLQNLQPVHYVVRAHDASTGRSDENTVEASATPDGPFNGLNAWFFDDFEDPATFAAWTVGTGPGPHSCGEWAPATASGMLPSGGAGTFLVADSECAPLAPRTSTYIDSPAVAFTAPDILAVWLEADVRYETRDGDDATIEVWDGAQWNVVWTDPGTTFNQHVSLDVSAYALGNPAFRARFNYQNANADRFFAIDDVSFVADVYSECATAPFGPPSVPDGSLRAERAGDDIAVSWDATSCPATGYNLLYGSLDDVAQAAISGSVCSIGAAGRATWTGVPEGSLFFLIVGADGASTESSWGRRSDFAERNGAAASNACGATIKDASNVCQ